MAPFCCADLKKVEVFYRFVLPLVSLSSDHHCLRGLPRSLMPERLFTGRTPDDWRQLFECSLTAECDLDPMILRARLLRSQGDVPQARSLEQELLPLL
jgi:hypothetical protein